MYLCVKHVEHTLPVNTEIIVTFIVNGIVEKIYRERDFEGENRQALRITVVV